MTLFKNRIGLSLLFLFVAAYLWEFYAKPVTGPIYTAAVNEYKYRNYEHSLQLLLRAYEIDPNDTGILTLMGWDYLKLSKPQLALEKFRRAHRLDPRASDTILGYATTEIELEHYENAARLLSLLKKRKVSSPDAHAVWEDLYRCSSRHQ
jgi:tetratricopeptide (TPR) repeat protein